ncbi:MAG: hypothetical protein DRP09_13320 [Candidatus Thorarchaeota archaeon]|nr:MAG: hypothetical protein DRP09_13320 [Candidatus Thorarchaeota archaeon]
MKENWIEEIRCNLCGGSNSEVLERCIFNRGSEIYPINMVRCLNCGLIYLNPRLNEMGLKEFYERYFQNQIDFVGNIEQINSSPYLMNTFLKKIEAKSYKGNLLDVGCGRGRFLWEARKRGWNVFGVEFSESAAQDARGLGLNVHTRDLLHAGFTSSYFDVVTMFNVIEHMRDPLSNAKEAHRILKENGLLVVRAPNIDWLDFRLVRILRNLKRIIKKFDKKYYFSRTGILNMFMIQHLFYFSRRTLRMLLEKAGFEIEEVSTRSLWYFQAAFKKFNLLQSVYFLYMGALSLIDQGSIMTIYARKPK